MQDVTCTTGDTYARYLGRACNMPLSNVQNAACKMQDAAYVASSMQQA